MQPDRLRGARDAVDDGALRVGGGGRRRQVDRLLEERTVERVGLVEKRERLQLTVMQQALQCVLATGDETLNQRGLVRLVALGAHLRLSHQRLQPRQRGSEFLGVVRPHHAAAAREGDGFDDTGIGHGTRDQGLGIGKTESHGEEPWHW